MNLLWLSKAFKWLGVGISTIFLIRLFKKNRKWFLVGAIGAFLIAVVCTALHVPDKIFYTALPLGTIIVTYLPDLFERK